MDFFNVDTMDDAEMKVYDVLLKIVPEKEEVPVDASGGRVLAEDVKSPINVPGFIRSQVDGYAVKSRDTAGATESIPTMLTLIGEVEMGEDTHLKIGSGECVYVPTGGMLPAGADAVVMIEYTEKYDDQHVAVNASAAPGKSVVIPGEDVKEQEVLLKAGTLIGPAQMAAFAACGIQSVPVIGNLKAAVFSTGDELVCEPSDYAPGKVYDINTTGITQLAKKNGMEIVKTGVLKDDRNLILTSIKEAMPECDVVIVSGGSSQGVKDHTEDIFNELSEGGVFTHGLAVKPGKPTILGYDEKTNTLLCGLPGHPVAAMMVFETVVGKAVRRSLNMKESYPVKAVMSENIACDPGKANCITVALERKNDSFIEARPIRGKSGLITTLAGADGYIVTDMNSEGLNKGQEVEVYLL